MMQDKICNNKLTVINNKIPMECKNSYINNKQ